jgi:hypothetical protein
LKRLGADGQCDPTHDTLAGDAGCKSGTVRRALDTLKGLGLVLWVTRLVRAGWRAAQTSNAYLLTIGDPASMPAVSCGGQRVRQTRKKAFISLQHPVLAVSEADRTEAMAALAERRRVIQERLLTKGKVATA